MNDKAKTWSIAALIGIVVYVAIDVLLVFLRPDDNLLHNAESDYGRGPYAWVMDINFLLRCALSLAFVKALWAAFAKDMTIKGASYWLLAWAIASGLLAFFADDPYGYPHLWTGPVHLVLAFLAFVAAIVGMILVTKRLKGIETWQKTGGVCIGLIVLAILSFLLVGHAGFQPNRLGGLYERIFLASVLTWEGIVAIKVVSISNKETTPVKE